MKKLNIVIFVILAMTVLVALPYDGYGDVINGGCYQKNNGQLRVLIDGSKCGPSEVPISWPGLPGPITILVDCDNGDKVTDALQQLGNPITIQVSGTCHENVVIKMDDVTIQGGTYVGPDPSQNTIHVQGARRVLITGATVGGARNGVLANQGGSLTVENSFIQGNARAGIVAIFGSSAVVNSCMIQNNTYEGAVATDNGALVVVNSTITSNGRAGINISRGSSARIGQNLRGEAGPNTIQNNGTGIYVYQSSQATIVNNIIQNNTGDGVLVEGSSARLTNNTINNNWKGIEVTSSGNARIGINDDGSAGIGNIIESNQLEGIGIGNGGAAYMLNNQIRLNGLTTKRAGVGIGRATGRLVGGNTIEGNGGHGVDVSQGALFQGKGDWNLTPGPDIIQQNGRSGISAWNGASLDIQNVSISNNTENGIVLNMHSSLRIFNSEVSGNTLNGIRINRDSAVFFSNPPVSVTDNGDWDLSCGEGESRYAWDPSAISGIVDIEPSCTVF